MAHAAFFDLDKTILAKSSSLMFAKPFYDSGLLTRSDVVRSGYSQLVYRIGGADHQQMDRMREYLSARCRGWSVEQVRAIVTETLDDIVEPTIYEEAVALIDQHRDDGYEVIIISSSGADVVEPIGERLGVDLAIGTQLEVIDGRYSGEILFYSYGEGKAEAMRDLAASRGYDLAECFAYSDSITDLPMLEAVGHPTVVNPDAQLRAIAVERSWPILDFERPIAMRSALARPEAKAAAVGAAAAVALGVVWIASRQRR